jgi:hypothetical protein
MNDDISPEKHNISCYWTYFGDIFQCGTIISSIYIYTSDQYIYIYIYTYIYLDILLFLVLSSLLSLSLLLQIFPYLLYYIYHLILSHLILYYIIVYYIILYFILFMYIISQYINDIVIIILIIICTLFLYHILQDMIYIFLYTSTRFYRYFPYYMYIFNLTLKYTNVQIMMLCTETINMYFMYIDLYMMQYYMHRSLHQQKLINNNNRHIANILSTSPKIVNVLSTYYGDYDMYRSLHQISCADFYWDIA